MDAETEALIAEARRVMTQLNLLPHREGSVGSLLERLTDRLVTLSAKAERPMLTRDDIMRALKLADGTGHDAILALFAHTADQQTSGGVE